GEQPAYGDLPCVKDDGIGSQFLAHAVECLLHARRPKRPHIGHSSSFVDSNECVVSERERILATNSQRAMTGIVLLDARVAWPRAWNSVSWVAAFRLSTGLFDRLGVITCFWS